MLKTRRWSWLVLLFCSACSSFEDAPVTPPEQGAGGQGGSGAGGQQSAGGSGQGGAGPAGVGGVAGVAGTAGGGMAGGGAGAGGSSGGSGQGGSAAGTAGSGGGGEGGAGGQGGGGGEAGSGTSGQAGVAGSTAGAGGEAGAAQGGAGSGQGGSGGSVSGELFGTIDSVRPAVLESYDDTIPDTLELTSVAESFLRGMTQSLLPDHDYAPAGPAIFVANDGSDGDVVCAGGVAPCLGQSNGVPNWGKVGLALHSARRMTSYDVDDALGTLGAEWKSVQGMCDPQVTAKLAGQLNAPNVLAAGPYITPTTVLLESLIERYRDRPGDQALRAKIDELVDYHDKLLVIDSAKGYGYFVDDNFPDNNAVDPAGCSELGTNGINMWRAFVQGRALRVMASWYLLSSDPKALKMVGLLSAYVRNVNASALWTTPDPVKYPPSGWQFVGQIHSYMGAVLGVLLHAKIVQQTDPALSKVMISFASGVFAFTKARLAHAEALGNFGEIGTVGDMLRVAMLLTELGEGDHDEEVERWTRNALVEAQIDKAAAAYIPNNESTDYRFDKVGYKVEGTFFSNATHAGAIPLNKNMRWNPDGPANAMRAVHEVWARVVTDAPDALRVNLLLNRAHRKVDVYSELPYAGRVSVRARNLGAGQRLRVRLPSWVSAKSQVQLTVDGAPNDFTWSPGQAEIVAPENGVTYRFDFPILVEKRAVATLREASTYWYEGSYPCEVGPVGKEVVSQSDATFRGYTAVDLGAPTPSGVPRYQRAALAALPAGNTPAPTRAVTRHVIAE